MSGTDGRATAGSLEHSQRTRRGEWPLAPAAVRLALIGAAVLAIAVQRGFYDVPPGLVLWINIIQLGLLVVHALLTRRAHLRAKEGGERWPGYALLGVLAVGLALHLVGRMGLGWRFVEGAIVLRFLGELWAMNVAISHRMRRPELLFPISFALLILTGAGLLCLPRATPPGDGVSFVDALFTSTSAVCVTGLAVRDTATRFTHEGQVIICLLIQFGGLGIILFGSTLMMMLGRNLSVRENQSLSQALNDQPVHRLLSFGRFVLVATLALELGAAAIMYPMWFDPASGPLAPAQRAWMSVFHAVSAFCNAGFDVTSASMVPYRHHVLAQGVIVPLIVLGGIGFPVLDELARAGLARLRLWRARDSFRRVGYRPRLSLHARVVLETTAWVYLYGVGCIALAQILPIIEGAPGSVALSPASAGGVLLDANFMCITSRTAGFNSVPMNELEPASVFTIMTLMVVGGSPGGTAGGVKTTALAVLVLAVVTSVRGRRLVEAHGRTIDDSIVRRAGALVLCYIGLIVVGTLALSLVERQGLVELTFETISALTTTGLSLGITPELTPAGKIVLVALMFVGRVGPLAMFTVMVFGRRTDRPYTYAHEGVGLG